MHAYYRVSQKTPKTIENDLLPSTKLNPRVDKLLTNY